MGVQRTGVCQSAVRAAGAVNTAWPWRSTPRSRSCPAPVGEESVGAGGMSCRSSTDPLGRTRSPRGSLVCLRREEERQGVVRWWWLGRGPCAPRGAWSRAGVRDLRLLGRRSGPEKLRTAWAGRRRGGWEQSWQRRDVPALPDGAGPVSKTGRCTWETSVRRLLTAHQLKSGGYGLVAVRTLCLRAVGELRSVMWQAARRPRWMSAA